MKSLLLTLSLVIVFMGSVNAQNVRYDSADYLTNPPCLPGLNCPVLAVPAARVQICNGLTTPCVPATTYASVGGQACPITAQVTLSGSGSTQCVQATASDGTFGVWVAPGTYSYYLTAVSTTGIPLSTRGPFPFTAGGSGSGGGVATVTATAPIRSSGGTNPIISATYQGNGGKVQASTGSTATNDCVKFDVNGNTVDAGAPCGTPGVNGVTATAPITSSGGANPVISATYQGNGAKVQASTGLTSTNDCIKFDAAGNTVDAGAPCGTVASVGAVAPLTSTGGSAPVISATYQGTGAKIQSSAGSTTTNDCVKFDVTGNTVDAGAPCGTGGGVSSVTATAPITSSGGANPVISGTYHGNGANIQRETGSTTTGNCASFDANGNVIDAGRICGVTSVTATAPITSTGGLTPVISATYQGTGAKVQASTGTATSGDCVKFDATGNTIDATAPCVISVTATAPLTSTGGASPVISGTYHGSGANIQRESGATTNGNCTKFDSTGNVVDAGAPCGTGGAPPGLINPTSVVCNGSTDDTAAWNTLLSSPGGTIILNKNCTSVITNISVTANNITLDCSGSTLLLTAATTGSMISINSITNFIMHNCVIDGNHVDTINYLWDVDNSTNIISYNNTFQNAGTIVPGHFSNAVQIFNSSGHFYDNNVLNVSGICVHLSQTLGIDFMGNRVVNCGEEGINADFISGKLSIANNVFDLIVDEGTLSSGAYGNAIYVSISNPPPVSSAVTVSDNTISRTQYSGIRVANVFNVNISNNSLDYTGDWGIYLSDFGGGENSAHGNHISHCLSGGILAANAGDDLSLMNAITGNHVVNCYGNGFNGLTPIVEWGQGIRADGMVLIDGNTVDGARYGIACDNGENNVYADFHCIISNNHVGDTRETTLTINTTTGTVAGYQNNIQADIMYEGASPALATKKAWVVSCAPVSSVTTCNTPTTVTVRNFGLVPFAAGDTGLKVSGTGTLSAGTIAANGVVGPGNFNITLASSANFNLWDLVHVGTGATSATGIIVCSNFAVGCPTANHVMVATTVNGSGFRVNFPTSGTLVDDTSSASSAISAATGLAETMLVGISAAKFDTTPSCSILIQDNHITGTTGTFGGNPAPIAGMQDSGGVPDGTVVALGPGTCVRRSPLMGNGPAITSGFGTGPAFVDTPTDQTFQVNVGTGGTASSGVVTWGVAYTSKAPVCFAADPSITVPVSALATTTQITVSVTGTFGASDLVSVQCSGGK